MIIQEFNNDQRREKVNSDQRFAAWSAARERVDGYRGSLVWQESKGEQYLVRSYYAKSGARRQKSLGRRSPETEQIRLAWENGRQEAEARFNDIQAVLERQIALNRAVGIGRMPLLGAKIIRAIDSAGLLGKGIRVVGTNAIYAYEAMAGVMVDSSITTTEDVDLLMDARRSLHITTTDETIERTLIGLLRRTDRSFERVQAFRAANKDGYLVDLVKPQRNPPWVKERSSLGEGEDELLAAPLQGLAWHEATPEFEAIAIDEKGRPLRIIATDPRVFVAHKLWLSRQADRHPIKRRRDESQARAVAQIVAHYLTHLPYEASELRMLPREIFEQAKPLFERSNLISS